MYVEQLARQNPPGQIGAYLLSKTGVLCSVDAPAKTKPHYVGDQKHVEFVFNGEEILEAYDGVFPCKVPLDLLPYGQCYLNVSVDGVAPDLLNVYMEPMPAFGQLYDFGTFCPIITGVNRDMVLSLPTMFEREGRRWNQKLTFERGYCFTAINAYPMKNITSVKL